MGTCPHTYPEIHIVGTNTVIACSECLVVLEHDIPTFTKTE